MAASIDYVGNRGRDNTGDHRHQRGAGQPATGRVTRLGVNVFDPNGALVPAERAAPTFTQFNQYQTRSSVGARHRLQLARARAREAVLEPLVRPRQLHAGALQRRRHRSSSTATRGSTTAAAIATTACLRDERQRRHRQGLWRRIRVPRLLRLSDQRDHRHRRQRRRHATTIARCRASTIWPRYLGAPGHRVGRRLARRRHPQRHRRREARSSSTDGFSTSPDRRYQAGLFLEIYNLTITPTSATRPARGTRRTS